VIYQKVNVQNYSNENVPFHYERIERVYILNWISELNVNDNMIIRMNMWVLCEYNKIMLL
jgi:hypothetical protein